MELKTFEDVKPFIAYIHHDENPNKYNSKKWDNSWVERCASEYVKHVSEFMDVDYNKLLQDLQKHHEDLYTTSSGHMVANRHYIHHFTKDPKPVYAARVVVDTYTGVIILTDITKGYLRCTFEHLWDCLFNGDFSTRYERPFPPRQNSEYNYETREFVKQGNTTIVDTIRFCKDLDIETDDFYLNKEYFKSIYKDKKYIGCKVGFSINIDFADKHTQTEVLKFFTTEEEANSFINEWKHKDIKPSAAYIEEQNRINTTYGDILSRVRKLTKDEVSELKGLIDNIYNQKVADAKLNPLQLCYEYMDKATEIHSYLIRDCALRDWFDDNYDANRYQLIEFADIFDRIMENYSGDAKWKNIKKKDKELIKELADQFQGGYKGFKVDW